MIDWDELMDVFYYIVNGTLWCFKRPMSQQKRLAQYALRQKDS
jgi:hypothetical protein